MVCVFTILQQELNTMSEEWNNHYIRASKFSQVSGIPEQLFKFPEIKGFEDQGLFVSSEDIEGLTHELDIHAEAEHVFKVVIPLLAQNNKIIYFCTLTDVRKYLCNKNW